MILIRKRHPLQQVSSLWCVIIIIWRRINPPRVFLPGFVANVPVPHICTAVVGSSHNVAGIFGETADQQTWRLLQPPQSVRTGILDLFRQPKMAKVQVISTAATVMQQNDRPVQAGLTFWGSNPCCDSSPDAGADPFAAAAAAAAARRSELGPGPAGVEAPRPGEPDGPAAPEGAPVEGPAAERVCRPESLRPPPKRVRPRVGPNSRAAVSTHTAAPPSLADQMRQVPSREEDSSASGMQAQKSMKVTGAVWPSSTDTGTPSWPSCRRQLHLLSCRIIRKHQWQC